MVIREVSEVITGPEVSEKLKKGSGILKHAVATTFGPFGRNVGITKVFNPPHVTKDGVTVAHAITSLKDPVMNLACQTVKEAAKETAKKAGDGTSSTVIVANSLIQNGFFLIDEGAIRPIALKRELDALLPNIEKFIDSKTKKVTTNEEIYEIAMVSSNNHSDISRMVTDAYGIIKQNGIVKVKSSNNERTFTELVDGIKIEQSHISSTLASGNKTEYKDPKILVTDFKFKGYDEMDYVIRAAKEANSPLLIICQELDDKAVESLIWARDNKVVDISVIGAPFVAEARREVLEDIAIATGATLLSTKAGWSPKSIDAKYHLGTADSVEITARDTNIIGRHGDKEAIDKRVAYYKGKIKEDTDGLKDNYKKRLAVLNAGSAVIYVGGNNPVEVMEKRDSIDDTVRAVQAALEFGIVDGGGKTYKDISDNVLGDSVAEGLLSDALCSVTKNILWNGELDDDEEGIRKFHASLKTIKDPALVVKTTIKNAIAAASMVLTTDCVIHQIEEDYDRE